VTAKAKAAKAINLIIGFLPCFASPHFEAIKKFQRAFAKRFSALNRLHNATMAASGQKRRFDHASTTSGLPR
jgi:hypothetical protein